MDDRKEAVEFLVKYLTPKQGGGLRVKRENGKDIVVVGDLEASLRTRRWDFITAFPKSEEVAKGRTPPPESRRSNANSLRRRKQRRRNWKNVEN